MAAIIIILLVVGIGCVLAALGQLWAVGGGIHDPVGARRPREPAPPSPSIVPGTLRSLIHGEMVGWKDADQWQVLTERLDALEADFGGVPSTPAPKSYSAEWLDSRIARIEALAGPMPEPLRPMPSVTQSRLPWKKS